MKTTGIFARQGISLPKDAGLPTPIQECTFVPITIPTRVVAYILDRLMTAPFLASVTVCAASYLSSLVNSDPTQPKSALPLLYGFLGASFSGSLVASCIFAISSGSLGTRAVGYKLVNAHNFKDISRWKSFQFHFTTEILSYLVFPMILSHLYCFWDPLGRNFLERYFGVVHAGTIKVYKQE